MSVSIKFFWLIVFVFAFTACTSTKNEEEIPFQKEILKLKSEVAPDKRVALFDISVIKNNNQFILKGESDLPHAVALLKEELKLKNADFIDSIQILPAANLEGKTHAIINISVANLRSNPKHSAELATQATLGTPVKILKKEGGWYYIQTPDKYLSWVDDGGITLMDEKQYQKWQAADKVIFTKTYGNSYIRTLEDGIVSDLVAGDVLEVLEKGKTHYQVRYPDGRRAYVQIAQAEEYNLWLEKMNPNEDDLITTSKTLMGVPYLWGGTSTKGMDCSGFTKTIYFLNGMVIPRDASQQVHTGKAIDSVQNFENLRKGDLLFFGRKATDSTSEKVVHVGMWIGNNEFIHASNMVRISSMDSEADNFDEWNRNRYLRTKRILKEEGEALINLTQTPLFKD
ncbi:C40 family peptidase [Aurantibacter crassamenti]|uniref:C40 family peptidase n=1 Tax=Aurantibacter crassamenti TaxID=1837375 RepID=UPI001939EF4A|nr:C40 family peptidase [Aurantibacter crassamenti]MBM1105206.1 C40 family peptidase [Aurantibacter crassamenti]